MTRKKLDDAANDTAIAGFTLLAWMLMATGAWLMWGIGAGIFTLGLAIFIVCGVDTIKE